MTPGKNLLLDKGTLITRHVAERELVSETESFSIHLEYIFGLLILDVEGSAETKEFLLHEVAHSVFSKTGLLTSWPIMI
jgi:hypothetical protein